MIMTNKSDAIRLQKELAEDTRRKTELMLEEIAQHNGYEILDPDDVETMQKRYAFYKEMLVKYGLPRTNLAAYHAIGVTMEQVRRWLSGQGFTNKRRKAFFERVQAECGVSREMDMATGNVSVPVGIFWQKNYDGLRDVSETIVHVDDTWNENQSPEELQARYADVIDADFTVKEPQSLPESAEGIQTVNVPAEEENAIETAETTSQEESTKKEALNE